MRKLFFFVIELAVDWAGFFPGWANFYPKKSAQGLGHIAFYKKPAKAKMSQVRSGLGQNGLIFLAVIVLKWADFVSFLDQNGDVEIIMSLILHLDTGKIQNTYYEIHF